jgi:ankyrin repeat protein
LIPILIPILLLLLLLIHPYMPTQGRNASKETKDVNEQSFKESFRGLLHVAVMNNHPKVVRDLIERGADPLKEDRMGLTPLHFAHLIGNPAVIDAFGDKGKLEPFSSSHMATPQEIKEATSFAVADPKFNIKVSTTLPHTVSFDLS